MKEESNLEAARLRYAGVATLLRRPLVNDPSGVDIALIGVPYDCWRCDFVEKTFGKRPIRCRYRPGWCAL